MKMTGITARPLTVGAFAPYGDVIEACGEPDKIINRGLCGRFHDRAKLDFGDGRAGVSLFSSRSFTLPFRIAMVERHPEGSQCFVPMGRHPFLVVVADGRGPVPGALHAFLSAPGQAVNLHRGIWHGVLTPLAEPGLFAVIDRIGDGPNLEEYRFDDPFTVVGSA